MKMLTVVFVLIAMFGVPSRGYAQGRNFYEPVQGAQLVNEEASEVSLPGPGWKFSRKKTGELTVIPLPAKEITVNTDGEPIKIVAPKGFWTPEKGSSFEKALDAWKSVAENEKVLGAWIKIDDWECTNVQEACVKIGHVFNGEAFSLAAFEEIRNNIFAQVMELVNKGGSLPENLLDKKEALVAEKIDKDMTWALEECRVLRPYINEVDKLGITNVRRSRVSFGDGQDTSYCVTSTVLFWMRGMVLHLSFSHTCGDVSKVDENIKLTQVKLNEWIDEINRINNRASLEAENEFALAMPGCMKSTAEKQKEQIGSRISNAVISRISLLIILSLAGGILTWRDAKKKKRNSFMN